MWERILSKSKRAVNGMRKKIKIALLGLGVALIGLLIWKLDIPHWQ